MLAPTEIRLVRPMIPAYQPARERPTMVGIGGARDLIDGGMVARVDRRADGRIRRLMLKARPGELGPRSHRTPTVVHDLPMNYSHNMRVCEAYAYLAASLV